MMLWFVAAVFGAVAWIAGSTPGSWSRRASLFVARDSMGVTRVIAARDVPPHAMPRAVLFYEGAVEYQGVLIAVIKTQRHTLVIRSRRDLETRDNEIWHKEAAQEAAKVWSDGSGAAGRTVLPEVIERASRQGTSAVQVLGKGVLAMLSAVASGVLVVMASLCSIGAAKRRWWAKCGRCAHCGYPIAGDWRGPCPECGL